MFEQFDHIQQKSLPPSPSCVREPDSEILPTASSSQFDGQYPSMVIGEVAPSQRAAQDTPQDLHTCCCMAEYSSPSSSVTDPCTYYPWAPADVTQAAGPYPSADHTPLSPVADDLQQLANRYMRYPGSRVDAVCMEQTPAGRVKVTITLEVDPF